MKPNIIDIFDDCVEAIRRKQKTVEECLRRHEDVHGELEPMLVAAVKLIEAGAVAPDARKKQEARNALLAAVEGKRWESGIEREILKTVPPRSRPRIFALGGRLGIIALIFLMLTGGAMAMAEESLPGSPLYPLKLGMERARIGLARDDGAKSKLYLNSAEQRMSELKKLNDKDSHYPDLVKAIATNIELAEEASGRDSKKEFTTAIDSLVKKNKAVLEGTLDKAPPSAKPALRRALANAKDDAKGGDDHHGEGTGKTGAGPTWEKDQGASGSRLGDSSDKETGSKSGDSVKEGKSGGNSEYGVPGMPSVLSPGSSNQRTTGSDKDNNNSGKESKNKKSRGDT